MSESLDRALTFCVRSMNNIRNFSLVHCCLDEALVVFLILNLAIESRAADGHEISHIGVVIVKTVLLALRHKLEVETRRV